MVFYASEYGIKPNQDVSEKFAELLQKLAETQDEKTLIFEQGDYYIDSKLCKIGRAHV